MTHKFYNVTGEGAGGSDPDVCEKCGMYFFHCHCGDPKDNAEDEMAYTRYRIDFENCSGFEFDYIILETMEHVSDYLARPFITSELEDEDARMVITGIPMTDSEWVLYQTSISQENQQP